jgi:hypothetical protein
VSGPEAINHFKHVNNAKVTLKIKRINFTVILIIFSLSIHAQVYQFRNFGFEEGLPHRFVYTINQDPSGYLWLGTGTELAVSMGFNLNPIQQVTLFPRIL